MKKVFGYERLFFCWVVLQSSSVYSGYQEIHDKYTRVFEEISSKKESYSGTDSEIKWNLLCQSKTNMESMLRQNGLVIGAEKKSQYLGMFSYLIEPLLYFLEGKLLPPTVCAKSWYPLVEQTGLEVSYPKKETNDGYSFVDGEVKLVTELPGQWQEEMFKIFKMWVNTYQSHGIYSVLSDEAVDECLNFFTENNITVVFDVLAGSGLVKKRFKNKRILVHACDIKKFAISFSDVENKDACDFLEERKSEINVSSLLLLAVPPEKFHTVAVDRQVRARSEVAAALPKEFCSKLANFNQVVKDNPLPSCLGYLKTICDTWINAGGGHILVWSDLSAPGKVLKEFSDAGRGELAGVKGKFSHLHKENLPFSYYMLHWKREGN